MEQLCGLIILGLYIVIITIKIYKESKEIKELYKEKRQFQRLRAEKMLFMDKTEKRNNIRSYEYNLERRV